MDDESVFKALSADTKALIIVREFEARRLPLPKMRALLQGVLRDEGEKPELLRLVEAQLQQAGYLPEQISAFLTDLAAQEQSKGALEPLLQVTRRLRSPFAQEFEPQTPVPGKSAQAGQGGQAAAVESPGRTPARPITGPQRRSSFGFDPLVEAPHPVPSPEVSSQGALATPAAAEQRDSGQFPLSREAAVVLLADDDKRIRMIFRLRLEAAGYTVVECSNGGEAWLRIQRGGIAAAVLDMKMPELHGLEVLSRMAGRQINVPVIICSAYDQLEDENVVQSYGQLRYLVKPVSPETLVCTVRELLAEKSS